MDWKLEGRHAARGLLSILDPVWRLHDKLGPMSPLLLAGLSAFVGLVTDSPAWGIATLFVALFTLAFIDVFRRERRAYSQSHGEVVTISELLRLGNSALDHFEIVFLFKKHQKYQSEEFQRVLLGSLDDTRQWMRDADARIREEMGDRDAELFNAHPNVSSTRPPSPNVPAEMHPLWEDVGARVTWLALRLQELKRIDK